MNPIKGGLGHEVTNFNKSDYSCGVISFTAFQKYFTTVEDLLNPPIYFVKVIHSFTFTDYESPDISLYISCSENI